MIMWRFIKLSVAAVMLVSVSAVSEAADVEHAPVHRLPPPAMPLIYSWTGFYVGGHLGVGWADGGSSGFLGGGQVGFNYQISPQWVLGVEGDIAGTTIKDTVNASFVVPGAIMTTNATASLDWVSTLAARAGYAFDRWLVYGKVGGAWAHASANITSSIIMQGGAIGVGTTINQTVSGLLLGVGTEYALWGNWSAKVEYNMMDFGNNNPFADNKFNVFKAGLNYRFGGVPF